MRLLVIGGSGNVARLITPILSQTHTLRIFDLRPPADTSLEFQEGNVGDPASLARAVEGMDALLYMAMGNHDWDTAEGVASGFDVNIKGLYFALRAAHSAGISHAVYTSSMSVYADVYHRYVPNEEVPADDFHFYGLTKRLGEEVCRAAVAEYSMTVNALRLCLPISTEKWLKDTRLGVPTIATTETDVARAVLSALERRFDGFEAFAISGDYEQKRMGLEKAKRLLDWEPLARPNH